MQATLEQPPTQTPPKSDDFTTLVISKTPKHPGLQRHVHKLWGNYYRINFHNVENENCIEHSYFVEVLTNGKIKYSWNEKIDKNSWKDREEISI